MFRVHHWPGGAAFWMSASRACGGGRRQRWWSDAMGDRPPRAERGEVRYLILDAIEAQPRHGYEIIQTIEQRAGGRYRPSPGVIYPTLQMLEELGHVSVLETEGRRAYAITESGRMDLEANRGAVRDFYERFEEAPWEACAEDFGDMMSDVGRLLRAFRRGARHGRMSPEAMRKVREALDEAVSRIEQAFETRR